ncbi:putative leucine-rich repeat receptor-like serine/threonine-protein kinase [Arachis hypogaea]|nr:putative leucine-rich repeat receptor-like serine/threonine-protein kinase [Arachis hypogaea]
MLLSFVEYIYRILSSNNFTGELPATLAKLTNLQDIRLGDNQFSGKIPDFIESWTNLKALNIIGSGLSGPIPSGISKLRNLTDLRISDLSGSEISSFPDLSNKSMKYLILRNCNIHGTLKDYLSTTEISQILDLSFNKLTGPIPPSYKELIKVNYIFLTGNLLNGSVPSWKSDATSLDLSYNNFNKDNQQCQYGKVNLFAASSPTINNSGIVSCLRSSVSGCPKVNSIHINCGGTSSVKVKGITYDEDGRDGTALFDRGQNKNWAVSTTGDYMDVEAEYSTASLNDTSALSSNDAYHQLYNDARVSPISLTYYGFCLHNGNYKVKLHFAEIMFTNDQTYKSLGRRLFHIYIQGTLVEKDFNIAKEAGGVGKAIIKAYTAAVINNTIEIRFYWAGKGTTIIPKKSVYGPLISAISVENGVHAFWTNMGMDGNNIRTCRYASPFLSVQSGGNYHHHLSTKCALVEGLPRKQKLSFKRPKHTSLYCSSPSKQIEMQLTLFLNELYHARTSVALRKQARTSPKALLWIVVMQNTNLHRVAARKWSRMEKRNMPRKKETPRTAEVVGELLGQQGRWSKMKKGLHVIKDHSNGQQEKAKRMKLQ